MVYCKSDFQTEDNMFSRSLLILSFLIASVSFVNIDAFSQKTSESKAKSKSTLSDAQAQDIIKFIKKRSGINLPSDASFEVIGEGPSKIEGFKMATLKVTSSKGSGDVPFLISNDGKYMIMSPGDPVDVTKLEQSPVKNLKQGNAIIGSRSLPILMTSDGKYLLFTELLDITADPFKAIKDQISMKNVPIMGNKNAQVTIVEYSDFQCPYCKRGADMIPKILAEYKDQVKIVFKQLPLSIHNWARPASAASLCAYKQGNDKFWEFHDLLFANQGQITQQNSAKKFNEFSKQIGLNQSKFDKCLKDPTIESIIKSEGDEALKLGANSTPTFFVNGMMVKGANYEQIKNAINSVLTN